MSPLVAILTGLACHRERVPPKYSWQPGRIAACAKQTAPFYTLCPEKAMALHYPLMGLPAPVMRRTDGNRLVMGDAESVPPKAGESEGHQRQVAHVDVGLAASREIEAQKVQNQHNEDHHQEHGDGQ